MTRIGIMRSALFWDFTQGMMVIP